ncbi:MAG: hypothetical protein Q4B59_04920 [Lachnospiraceae bacterium]|nr:hypothetical protein [Lachnospiraceae bacterium]
MFEKLQKKAENVLILFDLTKMYKKVPRSFDHAKRVQDRRVRRLVKKAYQIPFYKERFDAAGVRPEEIRTGNDLTRLPVLTKDELREWMNRERQNPRYKDWVVDTTSGSTGKPLSILFSPREKAFMKANWLRVMMLCGYNPFTGKTMSRINAHDEKAGGRDSFIQRFGILRHYYVDQYAPEEQVIDEINRYQPDWLYMNKTELMRLVLYANKTGKKIFHPRLYDPISEKVDENNRKLFKKILGDGIVDSYGSAETGACLLRRPGDDRYIIHYDEFVVNVLDEKGQLASEGSLVITPLYKTDLPLINYAIGDKANCVEEDGVRYITQVQGRMNDYFYYENGEVTSFFEVTPVIAHCSDILQIRFIEETFEKIHVQIVRDEKAVMSREEIEEYISTNLNKIFKKPFEFEFEWMNSIPPDKNGKLRMIVALVDHD